MSNLPPELEAHLLDLIEGATLAPAARARVDAALRLDPRLAAQVAGMIRDRGLIAGSHPSAPLPPARAGLLDAVEQALEREALLGLARSEAQSAGAIPVQRLTPIRTSVFSRPMARALALAAGLAVVSGLVWLAVPATRTGPREVAMNTPARAGPALRQAAERSIATGGAATAPGRVVETASDAASVQSEALGAREAGEVVAANTAGSSALSQPAAPAALTDAAPASTSARTEAGPAADAGVLSNARALRLAGEGRLALRVRGLSGERLDALTRGERGRRGTRWIEPDAGESERVLASVPIARRGRAASRAESTGEPTSVASTSAPAGAGSAKPAAPARGEPFVPPKPRVVVAAIPADEPGLAALVHAIEVAGGTVRLESLDQPAALTLPRDPLAILWWTLPPEAWQPPLAVPVVVE